MRRGSTIRVSLTLGLAAALLVIGASAATATIHTGGYLTKTRDIAIDKGETGGGRVACPSGYRVTAGGAYWLGDTSPPGLAVVAVRHLAASLPNNGGTSWYASGYNNDLAYDSATLRIVAHCIPSTQVGTYTVKTGWALPGGGTGNILKTVGCGTGRRVVTGGAAWQVAGLPLDATLATDHALGSSAPKTDARGWLAAGAKDSPSSASLRVVALCRSTDSVGTYQVRTRTFTPVGVPASVDPAFVFYLAGGSLNCPTGTRVVGGGAFWKNPFATPSLVADGLLGSSAPANGKRGWYAAGGPANSGTDRVLVVVVLCRPT